MKKNWTALGLGMGIAVMLATATARADDDGSWEVRLRGIYLDPANRSNAVTGLLGEDAITINHKWLPDLDIEHFFTPQWSTELVVTYPQSQDVYVNGTQIGTFKHLPPTLTGKYNLMPNSNFQPYIGAGVNFTLISDVNLVVPGVSRLYLSNHSIGAAFQAGFDYKIRDHWYVNLDVKWVEIGSGVYLPGGTRVTTVQINPFLFGLGVGYRFNL